jgi:hypothetical protein
MANVKISQLPLATSPLDSAVEMPVVQGGVTKRAGMTTIGFLQSGTSAVLRTAQAKMQDVVSVKDYGATGDGTTPDGAAIAASILANNSVDLPSGSYSNPSTAITLPFTKALSFDAGAAVVNSGTGTTDFQGTTIRTAYNPAGLTGWTGSASGNSFEGFAVDLSGYGPRSFSGNSTPTALSGSVSVPATASAFFHANGVAGYVKNANTASVGAVALYGQADRNAASALVWGLNTRTIDNGLGGSNVWGYELNLNISNITTTALGLDIVGGSTVEPSLSVAVNVQAIGVFESPKKRFTYAFRSVNAAAINGIELGSVADANSSASQPFIMNYVNGSGVTTQGLSMQVDGSGNFGIIGGVASSTLFALKTPGSTGGLIQLLGNNIGFFNAFPVGKPTVAGSRGGNAALASLLTALANLGLITDSTT